MKTDKDKRRILQKCYDNKITRHPNVREIIRKIKEITFWNTIIKDINKYVLKYKICQKKRSNKKLEIKQETFKLKEI